LDQGEKTYDVHLNKYLKLLQSTLCDNDQVPKSLTSLLNWSTRITVMQLLPRQINFSPQTKPMFILTAFKLKMGMTPNTADYWITHEPHA